MSILSFYIFHSLVPAKTDKRSIQIMSGGPESEYKTKFLFNLLFYKTKASFIFFPSFFGFWRHFTASSHSSLVSRSSSRGRERQSLSRSFSRGKKICFYGNTERVSSSVITLWFYDEKHNKNLYKFISPSSSSSSLFVILRFIIRKWISLSREMERGSLMWRRRSTTLEEVRAGLKPNTGR